MKKILLALLVPLVISAAAVAAPNPASATAHCKNLMRKSPAMFAPTTGFQYADLAACVAAKSAQAAKNTTNAAKTCKAEQAADAKAFTEKYAPATGNSKSNGKSNNSGKAMGACVSATSKASTAEQQKTEMNAAKKCKAERSMPEADFKASHEQKTFTQFYGKNKNGKNAFGKCVSAAAKAQQS